MHFCRGVLLDRRRRFRVRRQCDQGILWLHYVSDIGAGVGPGGIEDGAVGAQASICTVTSLITSDTIITRCVEN